jgi:hypothetical protein
MSDERSVVSLLRLSAKAMAPRVAFLASIRPGAFGMPRPGARELPFKVQRPFSKGWRCSISLGLPVICYFAPPPPPSATGPLGLCWEQSPCAAVWQCGRAASSSSKMRHERRGTLSAFAPPDLGLCALAVARSGARHGLSVPGMPPKAKGARLGRNNRPAPHLPSLPLPALMFGSRAAGLPPPPRRKREALPFLPLGLVQGTRKQTNKNTPRAENSF